MPSSIASAQICSALERGNYSVEIDRLKPTKTVNVDGPVAFSAQYFGVRTTSLRRLQLIRLGLPSAGAGQERKYAYHLQYFEQQRDK
jgi:hypothetical protein